MLDDDDQMREVMNANQRKWWRRWMIWLVGCVVVGVVAAVVAIVHAVSSDPKPPNVDKAALESYIQRWEAKRYPNTQIKVSCPSGIPIVAQTSFHCIARDGSGNSERVTVTIENSKGRMTWVAG